MTDYTRHNLGGVLKKVLDNNGQAWIPPVEENADYQAFLYNIAHGSTVDDVEDPAPGTPAPLVLYHQELFSEISQDLSTTSQSFVDLLSQGITTVSDKISVTFSASISTTAPSAQVQCQLMIDGAVKRGSSIDPAGATKAGNTTIAWRGIVTPGAHTVKIQWLVTAGTVRVRPGSTNIEHTSLIVREVE